MDQEINFKVVFQAIVIVGSRMSNCLDVEKVDLGFSQAVEQYDNWFKFFCWSVCLFWSISERSVVVKFRS